MLGFLGEFFVTVFDELRLKLVARRLRRKEQEIAAREAAVKAELEARRKEAAIAVHRIPENPYE